MNNAQRILSRPSRDQVYKIDSCQRISPPPSSPPFSRGEKGLKPLSLRERGRGEGGAALAISLVFLLVLTIIGVTAATTSTLEEKMSGNARDLAVSIQLSESGYRGGLNFIGTFRDAGIKPPEATGVPAVGEIWQLDGAGDLANQTTAWWAGNSFEYGVAGTKEFASSDAAIYYQAKQDPSYLVESYGYLSYNGGNTAMATNYDTTASADGRKYYRVSSFSTGLSGSTPTVIQGTTYIKGN